MSDNTLMGLIVAAVVLFAVAAGYAKHTERLEWERFSKAHGCKVVAHVAGDTFNTFGVGSNGQMTVGIGSTTDKTGWTCDDGITYFR